MSDRKSDCFMEFDNFSQPAGFARANVDNGFFNRKHVSFDQKTALLQYMVAHKDLFMRDQKDEKFWNNLVNQLNSFHDGAVRSVDAWKKTWQLWSANVQKKRNDLSITVLDLQLVSFLDSTCELERLRNTLETFFSDTKTSLSSDKLINIAGTFPELNENNSFIKLVEQLQALEHKEVVLMSESDNNTSKLSQLINKKQEIDTEITKIVNKLDEYETHISGLKSGKTDILNQIRNYIKPLCTL